MRTLRDVWEFVVGDDWRAAAGVFLALALSAALEGAGLAAWWVSPLSAVAILCLSVRRATAATRRRGS